MFTFIILFIYFFLGSSLFIIYTDTISIITIYQIGKVSPTVLNIEKLQIISIIAQMTMILKALILLFLFIFNSKNFTYFHIFIF